MITVGVDLAAEPTGTAAVRVDWQDGRAHVLDVVNPAPDALILGAVTDAATIGIDCPLGWPEEFVDFVVRHRDHGVVPADGDDPAWRRVMVQRPTDRACVEYTRRHAARTVRPLSVSADLLGHTALRCAVLLARLEDHGIAVDRSGVTGQVAEVYPAACLALWGVEPYRYKGARRESLPDVVAAVLERAPWLDVGRWRTAFERSDHCFDALIASLGARAVALGDATQPDDVDRARREGWINLPTGPLAALPHPS